MKTGWLWWEDRQDHQDHFNKVSCLFGCYFELEQRIVIV